MFKKLFSAMLVLTLISTPVGGFMLGDQGVNGQCKRI